MYIASLAASFYFITLSATLLTLAFSVPRELYGSQIDRTDCVCLQIQKKISSASAVYYPGEPNYHKGISHWSAASSQRAKCVVEPGRDADVAAILKIVGHTRTPFAVKGGGHTTNPGFSSTTGVHITMTRFSDVKYHTSTRTVEVGMGLLWDDVYAVLEPYNRTVVGGRISGVGVAGLSLGGGYSWKTNQYGLTVDTIEAFRLVKPDGTITTVTHASQPELFFALKGTHNNFGIVTKIIFRTFPQTAVWGGKTQFPSSTLDDLGAATAAFYANIHDPKASLLVKFAIIETSAVASLTLFYDGPTPPPGTFDSFLLLPVAMDNLKTQSYLSFIKASSGTLVLNKRVLFQPSPHIDITPQFMNAALQELTMSGQELTRRSNTSTALTIEPFLPNILQHTNLPSAYPASRTTAYFPFNVAAIWPDVESDGVFHQSMKGVADRLRAIAVAQGQKIPEDAPMYPNYALYDTPLEHIFGINLPRLRKLKREVDPHNVMGLAGGFKL